MIVLYQLVMQPELVEKAEALPSGGGRSNCLFSALKMIYILKCLSINCVQD